MYRIETNRGSCSASKVEATAYTPGWAWVRYERLICELSCKEYIGSDLQDIRIIGPGGVVVPPASIRPASYAGLAPF